MRGAEVRGAAEGRADSLGPGDRGKGRRAPARDVNLSSDRASGRTGRTVTSARRTHLLYLFFPPPVGSGQAGRPGCRVVVGGETDSQTLRKLTGNF